MASPLAVPDLFSMPSDNLNLLLRDNLSVEAWVKCKPSCSPVQDCFWSQTSSPRGFTMM